MSPRGALLAFILNRTRRTLQYPQSPNAALSRGFMWDGVISLSRYRLLSSHRKGLYTIEELNTIYLHGHKGSEHKKILELFRLIYH